ncbi:DUF4167 domain-containing protein (plasmid) [Azospirillum oryzae]|uniref:DUF4167 domain-containing protein n=2 Tax=Azospirillum oryzae TaxID=286727 RepID=A0A6N1AR18_9PROT|nr:DUF4167 domain-containing protein [Azospirillum oryzae]KAA0587904.1 DUF4167 domain-containing protein [Azospirillum oryzae]QKS54020.1 DUF4167 domain-containing protein [Azospirillum oryzae]GLR77826.1 hypothetical protein GCM10007856_04940 [Azospirillum oryzae]
MAFESPTRRGAKPSFRARPRPAFQTDVHPANRMGGSAVQKQAQWLSRAAEADRAGDAVQAELCRQYAEHWFRVSRGQE